MPPPPSWVLGEPEAEPREPHDQEPNTDAAFPATRLRLLIIWMAVAGAASIAEAILLLSDPSGSLFLTGDGPTAAFVMLLALLVGAIIIAQRHWVRFAAVDLPSYLTKAPARDAEPKVTSWHVRQFQQAKTEQVLAHMDLLHGVDANALRPWEPNTPTHRPEAEQAIRATAKRIRRLYGLQMGTAVLVGLVIASVAMVLVVVTRAGPLPVIFLAYPIGVLVSYWVPIHVIRLWCRAYNDAVFADRPAPQTA